MSQPPSPAGLSQADYAALARFRYELRRFASFSAAAAQAAGVPAQQHQALLAIKGREGPTTVSDLAEQLLIAPHTAAELVARMAGSGLLTKTPSPEDRRSVHLSLTVRAEALLHDLTAIHLEELRTLEPALARSLGALTALRRTDAV